MFFIHTIEHGHVPPAMNMRCGNIVPKAGMALSFTSGALTVASGDKMPQFISLMEASENQNGKTIPVMQVSHDVIYATTTTAALTAASIGTKVQIAGGGLEINATAGGTAKLMGFDTGEAGTAAYVRFEE